MTPTRQTVSALLALFGSTGTLLCCALPAALAAIAGGAAVSTFVSAFPLLIPLSRHKGWLFLVSGLLIVLSGALTLRPKGRIACAINGGTGCEVAGRFAKLTLWASVGVYTIGAFFAFGIVPILKLAGG